MLLFAAILASVAVGSDSSNDGLQGDLEEQHWLQFTLLRSCGIWAQLQWGPSPETFPASKMPPHFATCEITYMNMHTQEVKLLLVVPSPRVSELTLENLQQRSHYMASMTCNETITSPTIRFVTGFPCTEEEMEKVKASQEANTTEVSQHPIQMTKASGGLSVTDTVLGLLFALCGVTVTACAALYYWKRRRHRQRILRIFRQSQSDPFLALHSSVDQTPTSSF